MEIIRFQSALGLFIKQTHKAATFYRTWTARKSICSSLVRKLSQSEKILESFLQLDNNGVRCILMFFGILLKILK